MKKIIYAAVALMLTACGGNVSSGESASAKDGLSGKVHKVQTLIYNAKQTEKSLKMENLILIVKLIFSRQKKLVFIMRMGLLILS